MLHFSLQKRRIYATRFVRTLRAVFSTAAKETSLALPAAAVAGSAMRSTVSGGLPITFARTKAPSSKYVLYTQYVTRASLCRRSRRKQLRRKSRLHRLKYRTRGRYVPSSNSSRVIKNNNLDRLRSTRLTVAHRLVATTSYASTLAPLFFQRPVSIAVKSAGAKNKAILANITSKESRYKVTAQYAESLLEFIPAFISQMLSKKIKINEGRITYKVAQHLVRNIY